MHDIIETAGVDEVGIGCIAGPVMAAAVMFKCPVPEELSLILDDSKKIKADHREIIYNKLMNMPHVHIGIAAASVAEILILNIKNAATLAMQRAVNKLAIFPKLVLVDGIHAPNFGCATQTIIKGDGLSLSIAAASIVAKVVRDRLMCRLSKRWFHYGWEFNAGYPTAYHRKALEKYGCTPYHRQGFTTVSQLSFKTQFSKYEAASI